MDRLPTKSTRICIHEGCSNLPTIVVRGQVRGRANYEVQSIACYDHESEALGAAKTKYPRVTFEKLYNPSWLTRAQIQELQVRS
jgi:hypothetical protein